MTDPVRAILDQLIARRKQLKLTQTEIARRCHVTPNAISQLERRKHAGTTLATAIRYANAMGMQLTLTGADDE